MGLGSVLHTLMPVPGYICSAMSGSLANVSQYPLTRVTFSIFINEETIYIYIGVYNHVLELSSS
jgi:hypothetical protein